MIALICFIWSVSTAPFKSNSQLEAENAALRHQVVVLQRKVRGRLEFTNGDRLFFILLYRWFPSVLKAMVIVRPETVVRWHRAGFRHYWHSRRRGGRPPINPELRALIRRMSQENVHVRDDVLVRVNQRIVIHTIYPPLFGYDHQYRKLKLCN